MRIYLFLSLFFASATALLAGARQAPVQDAVWLSRVSLNRLELKEPAETPAEGLLPSKTSWLPLSVQLYLKPSGQLNAAHPTVQKLAGSIRRKVAPGSAQKDRLRDSRVLAAAVWETLEETLPVNGDLESYSTAPSLDWRLAWPKASAVLKSGVADGQARVMVEAALLRALKVPARTGVALGRPVTQYWVPFEPIKTKKGSKSNPPLGHWALLDPNVLDEDLEAWSLDAGMQRKVYWMPAQELEIRAAEPLRWVFPQSQSAAARASFDASLESGSLSITAGGEALAAGLSRTPRPAGVYFVLSLDSYRLEVDGSMAAMTVDLFCPYRPHLNNWGREWPDRVKMLEAEAQGIWTDRPLRLRLKKNGQPQDEWQSPPPALGVLHYVSAGLRRPSSVLQARVEDGVLKGVFFRADNLTPRADWDLLVTPQGTTSYAQVVAVASDGHFSLPLSAEVLSSTAFTVGSVPERKGVYQGDLQFIRLIP